MIISGILIGGAGGDVYKNVANTFTAAQTITPATPGTALTLNGGTLTGASAPALVINQTWNNASTIFTGLQVNVTNTLSSSSSSVIDVKVGGTSKFSVQPDGTTNVYNTYTDASNYESGRMAWATNVFTIGTSKLGTGASRRTRIYSTSDIAFTPFDGNLTSGIAWQITTGGHFLAFTDNAYDIGASAATRPRNLFLAGGITHGSATLLTTTTALTNGAAASAGTLTNAPAVGNPTKWIPVNDNGTTRYIPAW